MRENPKTQDSTCGLPCFFLQKVEYVLWSILTFWYKGSAEIKEQMHVRKKACFFQKQQPKTKSVIFKNKMIYDVKMLILVRYDIILHI